MDDLDASRQTDAPGIRLRALWTSRSRGGSSPLGRIGPNRPLLEAQLHDTIVPALRRPYERGNPLGAIGRSLTSPRHPRRAGA